MKFNFNMPVEIISGESCIAAHPEKFALGKSCLIVTGRSSAVKSGALVDVTAVLDSLNISYKIFNEVRENPLMSMCWKGRCAALDCGADFVIGIGGGSALDASKAIAAYAGNPEVEAKNIFTGCVAPSLPLIAIPTTSGTGSEGNSYSVLSLDGENRKKTFKNAYSFAKTAFLDPRYTYSLDSAYTVSTALDAFCHGIESYMSPKSTVISRLLSVWAAKTIFAILREKTADYSPDDREKLMFASCAAGIAINTTGTGFPHPLGYNLTMFKGLSHGKACAVFTGAFIEYTRRSPEGKELTDSFAAETELSLNEISELTRRLADFNDALNEDEIELFISKVKTASNFANNPYVINENEMHDIYRDINK